VMAAVGATVVPEVVEVLLWGLDSAVAAETPVGLEVAPQRSEVAAGAAAAGVPASLEHPEIKLAFKEKL